MGILRNVVMLLAFAVCFLAVGIPYWQVPYAEIGLPDTLMTAGLALVVLVAGALRATAVATVPAAGIIIGAAVPAAVFARIGVEVAADSTSHNLWPLELALALPPGLAAAFAGALAGALVARLIAWRSDGGDGGIAGGGMS